MDIYLAASRLGEYPFSSQMEAIVFIILQTFFATCAVLKIGKYYRKIYCLTSEFLVKFHVKNRYCTNREAMSAISVFQVKFNVEFTYQAVNFS